MAFIFLRKRIDMTPDAAGATIMAAGGSAPELFTSLIGTFISRSTYASAPLWLSCVQCPVRHRLLCYIHSGALTLDVVALRAGLPLLHFESDHFGHLLRSQLPRHH